MNNYPPYTGCAKGCCFHAFTGPLLMVVPDGHVVEKCCRCGNTRTIHREHRSSVKTGCTQRWRLKLPPPLHLPFDPTKW